jgi:hypothetical protein
MSAVHTQVNDSLKIAHNAMGAITEAVADARNVLATAKDDKAAKCDEARWVISNGRDAYRLAEIFRSMERVAIRHSVLVRLARVARGDDAATVASAQDACGDAMNALLAEFRAACPALYARWNDADEQDRALTGEAAAIRNNDGTAWTSSAKGYSTENRDGGEIGDHNRGARVRAASSPAGIDVDALADA